MKNTYDIIVSRASLKSHPITEAIEQNAKFKESNGDSLIFVEKVNLFGIESKVLYFIENPEKIGKKSAKFAGEIMDIYFELFDKNIENVISESELIFGVNQDSIIL